MKQLDLFGDFFEDFEDDTLSHISIKENENEQTESMVRGNGTVLEEIPSANDSEIGGNRNLSNNAYSSSDGSERIISDPRVGSGSTSLGSTDSSEGAISQLPARERSPVEIRNVISDIQGNYIIPQDISFEGGKVKKYEENLEAVRVLKILETESRHATVYEQEILAKYVGWGGLPEAFAANSLNHSWSVRAENLRALFTPEEYETAKNSTLSAFYTEPFIAKAMWTAVERMGFQGGQTLDPSTGSGIFFGTRPLKTAWPISLSGIEIDSLSGRIAQQLYQGANINITPFENYRISKDRFNLVITNVPFSEIKPYEPKAVETPNIGRDNSLHDFFILKALYGTRPGGFVSVITSRHTLDKESTTVRESIANSADFLGAMRLPSNAFTEIGKTEVTTDILFFQKRPVDNKMSALTKEFINTTELSLTNNSTFDFTINAYFVSHPEMVLGLQSFSSGRFSDHEYCVLPHEAHLKTLLENAITYLPVAAELPFSLESSRPIMPQQEINTEQPKSHFLGEDNRLYRRFADNSVALSDLYLTQPEDHPDIVKICKMVSIAETTRQAIDKYYEGQTVDSTVLIKKLNSTYNDFVLENGYINEKKNLSLIYEFPDIHLLCALEKWDSKTKTATKSDIFNGINFHKTNPLTKVEKPEEALIQSCLFRGSINADYMASILPTMEKEAIIESLVSNNIIFKVPEENESSLNPNSEHYILRNEYLSGNVREKLKIAKEYANTYPSIYFKNVRALESVMPMDIAPEDIFIQLNSPFINDKYIKQFFNEIFDANTNVHHIKETGRWDVTLASRERYGKYKEFCTDRLNAVEIAEKILNGKPLKVYDYPDKDKPPVLNEEASSLADSKATLIKEEFHKWIWNDPERTDSITKVYNELYNSHVDPVYTHPARLIDPSAPVYINNCAFPFPLRPNQADAIWRVINSQNTMLAHAVGAGKTLEIACSAMELKRLGIRNKPMIVVPDHLINQWAKEFRDAFPTANLLVADDNNWNKNARRSFLNRAATGNYDAIIIRMESFKMLPVSNELQKDFFQKKIDTYNEVLTLTPKGDRNNRSVKDLVKRVEKYKNKIKELSDIHVDEGVIPFDKIGIDHLFVDEADNFKNLEYTTQMENIRGMGTALGSERAFDMAMKVQFIQNTSGGVTFATGTPISNSLVEAYTMQRYLQPELLKKQGIEAFDEWARCYSQAITSMEQNNTGTGYQSVTRFSKIANLPELMSSLRQTWDIQTPRSLEKAGILVPGVNLPYFKQINTAAPSNKLLQSYLKDLARREGNLSGRSEKGKDNVLTILTDGRKASLDLRLIHKDLPDIKESKPNQCVDLLIEKYYQYEKESYVSVVFCDKPASKDSKGMKSILKEIQIQ